MLGVEIVPDPRVWVVVRTRTLGRGRKMVYGESQTESCFSLLLQLGFWSDCTDFLEDGGVVEGPSQQW